MARETQGPRATTSRHMSLILTPGLSSILNAFTYAYNPRRPGNEANIHIWHEKGDGAIVDYGPHVYVLADARVLENIITWH